MRGGQTDPGRRRTDRDRGEKLRTSHATTAAKEESGVDDRATASGEGGISSISVWSLVRTRATAAPPSAKPHEQPRWDPLQTTPAHARAVRACLRRRAPCPCTSGVRLNAGEAHGTRTPTLSVRRSTALKCSVVHRQVDHGEVPHGQAGVGKVLHMQLKVDGRALDLVDVAPWRSRRKAWRTAPRSGPSSTR